MGVILFAALGATLAVMGFGVTTWQFWTVLLIAGGIRLTSMK